MNTSKELCTNDIQNIQLVHNTKWENWRQAVAYGLQHGLIAYPPGTPCGEDGLISREAMTAQTRPYDQVAAQRNERVKAARESVEP